MKFLFVYLREAHPSDGWASPKGQQLKDATTLDERKDLAEACCQYLEFDFPTVADTMDDRVAVEYGAWPERLFVVNTQGVVVYAGKPGPVGFHPGKGHTPYQFGMIFNEDTIGPSLEEHLQAYCPDPLAWEKTHLDQNSDSR